jgi:hypothetical protein
VALLLMSDGVALFAVSDAAALFDVWVAQGLGWFGL